MTKNTENVIDVVFGCGGGRIVHDAENSDVVRARKLFDDASRLDGDVNTIKIAEQMYDEAIKLDSMFVEALVATSIIKIGREEFNKAEEFLLRALKFRPTDADTLFNLGTLYLRMFRYDHSLRCLSLALKIDPEDERAHHNIALVYEAVQMFDIANQHWKRVIELSPDDTHVELIRARLNNC